MLIVCIARRLVACLRACMIEFYFFGAAVFVTPGNLLAS